MPNVRPLRATAFNDEELIRQSIRGFQGAFRTKDLDGIIFYYAPDVVAYDLLPPLQHKGIQAWRSVWEPMMKGDIDMEVRDLKIEVSGNLVGESEGGDGAEAVARACDSLCFTSDKRHPPGARVKSLRHKELNRA